MTEHPLVSVVIPTYNHLKYLETAIESVKRQTYPYVELVVLDDGSTDGTRQALSGRTDLTYVYQENRGLPYARNAGFAHSSGGFVQFLDADDWLLPNAIEDNLHALLADAEAVFAYGMYEMVDWAGNLLYANKMVFDSDHYRHLLWANVVGNPSTVMYRRSILEKHLFNTSPEVKGCEDYDHYFTIAREHKVISHPGHVAVYRKHDSNMSNNVPMMLRSIRNVHNRQKKLLRNKTEQETWYAGSQYLVHHYVSELVSQRIAKGLRTIPPFRELLVMARYPLESIRCLYKQIRER